MRKALVLFDKSENIEKVVDTLAGYEVCFLTANVKKYLWLKEKGLQAFLPQDMISPEESHEIDRLCFEFIGSIFKTNGRDYSSYKGIEFGSLSEYSVSPLMVRIYRYIYSIKKLVGSLRPERVVVVGSDEFARAAKTILRDATVPASFVRGGVFWRIVGGVKLLWEGRKTRWIHSEFKNQVLEWVLEVLLVMDGIRRKRRGPSAEAQYRLIFTGDKYAGHMVHERFKDMGGWQLTICGMDYRMRKRDFKGVRPIEGFVEAGMLFKVIGTFLYFLVVWFKMNFDAALKEKFTFEGVNYWACIRPTLRNYCLILFPRLYLDYLISSRAFSVSPEKTFLVLPFDVMPYTRALVAAAKKCGVKSLVIQHGILGEVNGHKKLFADYLIGWGEFTRQWYGRFGNDPRKVIVAGNPGYDEYFTGDRSFDREKLLKGLGISPDKKIIAVFTTWTTDFSATTYDLDVTEMIEATMRAVSSLGLKDSAHVIIKIHPVETLEKYMREYEKFRKMFPAVSISKDSIERIFPIVDVCVTNYSSVMLESMIYHKPVVVYCNRRYQRLSIPLAEYTENSGAVLHASSDKEMEAAINGLLHDREVLEGVVSSQRKFLEDFIFRTDGRSTERVYEAIERLAADA